MVWNTSLWCRLPLVNHIFIPWWICFSCYQKKEKVHIAVPVVTVWAWNILPQEDNVKINLYLSSASAAEILVQLPSMNRSTRPHVLILAGTVLGLKHQVLWLLPKGILQLINSFDSLSLKSLWHASSNRFAELSNAIVFTFLICIY